MKHAPSFSFEARGYVWVFVWPFFFPIYMFIAVESPIFILRFTSLLV